MKLHRCSTGTHRLGVQTHRTAPLLISGAVVQSVRCFGALYLSKITYSIRVQTQP
jgi:hypothetical protein